MPMVLSLGLTADASVGAAVGCGLSGPPDRSDVKRWILAVYGASLGGTTVPERSRCTSWR